MSSMVWVNDHVNTHTTNLHDNGLFNVLSFETQNTLRILMFPWLAHGHVSPFLELAKKLANTKNFTIYLCSTPIILTPIKKKFEGITIHHQ
ncbi:hypothetical protein Leryth_005422 [Lithospermum erythrorhizon]|nr:hypothetical protein Leryth_005422 [Lithospermum erythrorhizon]